MNLFVNDLWEYKEVNEKMTFGEKLKAERIKKGVSELQVATTLGLSQSAISKYEHGIKEPSKGALVALAKYYDVSLDYLVNEEN